MKNLPDLDISRGKPRNFLEWKTLRRWDRLPLKERSVPGYILRLAREEAKLTQKALASRLGTSQQAVAQAERWQSNPTVAFMSEWVSFCDRKLILDIGKPLGFHFDVPDPGSRNWYYVRGSGGK